MHAASHESHRRDARRYAKSIKKASLKSSKDVYIDQIDTSQKEALKKFNEANLKDRIAKVKMVR